MGQTLVVTLQEMLRGGLKAVFVGLNPISVEAGHYAAVSASHIRLAVPHWLSPSGVLPVTSRHQSPLVTLMSLVLPPFVRELN